eukprot:scaffold77578_cov62-Phaeocystis_antarctica.AAC.3
MGPKPRAFQCEIASLTFKWARFICAFSSLSSAILTAVAETVATPTSVVSSASWHAPSSANSDDLPTPLGPTMA